jgi:hypothetical protein
MPKSNLPKRSIPMIRNADGVLETLYDEMDAFLDGKVDGKHAATVARVANSIIKALPFAAEQAD